MATTLPSASDVGVENTKVNTAEGVSLSDHQNTLVGSVLDLFAGRPSLKKLRLWEDDASFEDPLTVAKGRKQYEPQWYGLAAMFSTIERLHHSVTSAGNPIEMDLKTRYVVKGVGTEKVIDSKIVIDYNESTGRITRLQDRWSGDIPTSSFAEVSVMRLLSPWWWLQSVEAVGFWLLTLVWETRLAQTLRKLNANTVPHLVSVPKNDEEDAARMRKS